MMQYPTTWALGQARLAELHRQAQLDALAGAARRQRSARPAAALLAAVTRWTARREAVTDGADGPGHAAGGLPPALRRDAL